jgi:hypothetical protein
MTHPSNGDDARAPAPGGDPRWLLWSTGLIALALGTAAFLLWGTSSAAYLLELAVAYCT